MTYHTISRYRSASHLIKGAYIFTALLFLLANSLLAKTYYVDPNRGNDSGLGALGTPWRTIAKANATLRAGDTVFLRGGEYNADIIRPASSGTAGNEIVYIGYPGEAAVITNAKAVGGVALVLDGRSYIVIDNVVFDGKNAFRQANIRAWASLNATTYSVISNCKFKYAEGWSGISLNDGARYNKIINNTIDHCGAWVREDGFDHGDALALFCAEYNLIEGNTFTRGGHNLLAIYGSHNIIKNNIFDNLWGVDASGKPYGNRCIEISDRERGCYASGNGGNVLENNIIRNAYQASDTDQPRTIKINGTHQIARYNYVYNMDGQAIVTASGSGASGGPSNTSKLSRIYHNTFYRAGESVWCLFSSGDREKLDNNIFKNNISFNSRHNPRSSSYDVDIQFNLTGEGATTNNNQVISNIIFQSKGVTVGIGGVGRMTLAEAERRYPAVLLKNNAWNPMFVSSKLRVEKVEELYLQAGSPAIDFADWLTLTRGSGSGQVLTVQDARYFTDGKGIVNGDMLKVGKNAPVRITKIDYATNTITLAGSIAWSDKDPVSLPYVGNAPDIGAYEYNPYNGGGGGNIVRTSYFIDPVGGNDANDGSQGKPWKTLSKANATLTPGDTVYLRAGEYAGQVIRPAASGQAGKPIHYLAFSSEKPVLTNAKASGGTAINLDDRSYINVRGIEVDGKAAFKNANVLRWLSMSNTSYSTVSGCRFQYAEGPEGVLLTNGSQYNKLLNNTFDHSGAWNDGSGKPAGELLSVQCASFNTIEGNQFLRGGNALLYVAGERNVIRRNRFDNSWGVNGTEKLGGHGVILTHSPSRSCSNGVGGNNLFEGNQIKNVWKRADGTWAKALEVEGEGQVVRQNYIFEAAEGIVGYLNTVAPIGRFNRIYHNTVVTRDGWSFVHELSAEDSRSNVLKNNIAITTDGQRPHIAWNVIADGNGAFNGSQFVNNCFFSAPTDSTEEMYVEGIGKSMIGKLEAEHRQEVFGNLPRDPRFVRSAMSSAEDLQLDYYSPLVDAGERLTFTVSSGSGSVIQVADSRYFTNGFGIVPGDQIQIGSNTVAEVTQVDHSTNRITVNRSISWSANAPVSLVFKGTGPDVGAFETDILTHIGIGK